MVAQLGEFIHEFTEVNSIWALLAINQRLYSLHLQLADNWKEAVKRARALNSKKIRWMSDRDRLKVYMK